MVGNILANSPSTKALCEKLWVGFYNYLKSDEYQKFWLSIVEIAKTQSSPVLYYFITRYIPCDLIQKTYPLNTDDTAETINLLLNTDEEAALSYVTGYIIRAVIKKIETRKLPNKDKLKHALENFREHPDDIEEHEHDPEISEWMSLRDRGGVYHVRHKFLNFLHSMEIVVKRMMINSTGKKGELIHETLSKVKKAEDILFFICSIVMVDNETAKVLITSSHGL